MPDIMKMGKNPNYLGSWDLDDLPNREVTLTIARIVDEEVVTNGKTEVCTACYWQEAAYKPMILNVTNKKTLCKLYKTKATEKLAGRAVTIGIDRVMTHCASGPESRSRKVRPFPNAPSAARTFTPPGT